MNTVEAELPASVERVSSPEISTLIYCNTSGSSETTEIFTSLLPDASSVGVPVIDIEYS